MTASGILIYIYIYRESGRGFCLPSLRQDDLQGSLVPPLPPATNRQKHPAVCARSSVSRKENENGASSRGWQLLETRGVRPGSKCENRSGGFRVRTLCGGPDRKMDPVSQGSASVPDGSRRSGIWLVLPP